MSTSYSEKLKDPRWQKLRLKIFERDQWICKACGAGDQTLCVHHLEYCGEPWEARERFLETLCEPCHQMRAEINGWFQFQIERCPSAILAEAHRRALKLTGRIFARNEGVFLPDVLPGSIGWGLMIGIPLVLADEAEDLESDGSGI